LADLHELDQGVDKQLSLSGLELGEVLHEFLQLVSDRRRAVGLFLQVVDLVLQSPPLFLEPGLFLGEVIDCFS
jgi:hypothetical protein